jgi:hypothetical protein
MKMLAVYNLHGSPRGMVNPEYLIHAEATIQGPDLRTRIVVDFDDVNSGFRTKDQTEFFLRISMDELSRYLES